MKRRLNFARVQPAAYTAMDALDNYLDTTSIDKLHKDLIRLRASQINGCGYCVDMHARDARNGGATEQKVFLVSAWREAGSIFTDEEKLMFEMTEELTLIHQHGLSDDVYDRAIATFGEEKTSQLMMVIVTINAWNRIGVGTNMHPPIQKS